MAAIFKRTGKDGKPAKKWSYKFKDEKGKWVTKTGHRLKESTERMAEADEDRAKRIRKGEETPVSESTLATLLISFRESLESKNRSERHVEQTAIRVKRVFDDCKFVTPADLRSSKATDKFDHFLSNLTWRRGPESPLRPASKRTRNHYVVALKMFCRWAVKTRKLPDCPLVHLGQVTVTDARKRRAATADEIRKIIKAAGIGPEAWGLTGTERAMLYRLAVNTGFRVSELASLTPASFVLGKSPYVFLEAERAKNRKEVEQPLPVPLVGPLRGFLKGLPADQPIWPGNWVYKAAKMLRTDMEKAEVEGLDFHSLRTTFITNLARSGVHPKTAQELARHSDINLTMNYYTKLKRDELAAALPCI
jgi:integrase/recombinase XerD